MRGIRISESFGSMSAFSERLMNSLPLEVGLSNLKIIENLKSFALFNSIFTLRGLAERILLYTDLFTPLIFSFSVELSLTNLDE